MNQFTELKSDGVFHIYNRAVGKEKLFVKDENYKFFLRKAEQHLLSVMDMFAYSLLPNHFHMMVRVKDELTIREVFEEVKKRPFDDLKDLSSEFLMERVGNWLNSYAKAFNKMYDRKGALFMPTKRTEAVEESSFTNFIFYIHKNAVHHGLATKVGDWKHDSYSILIQSGKTYLLRDEIFNWFGSREVFIKVHEELR